MEKDNMLKYLTLVLRQSGLKAYKVRDLVIFHSGNDIYILNFGNKISKCHFYNAELIDGWGILNRVKVGNISLNDLLVRLMG